MFALLAVVRPSILIYGPQDSGITVELLDPKFNDKGSCLCSPHQKFTKEVRN